MSPSSLTHIYLSPHIDDAVFSCGGLISHQARAGRRVVVVTICAGNPPAGLLSPYAQSLHERWSGEPGTARSAAEIVAHRRNEDLAALAELGAEAVHLDVPDCIYRLNPATGWGMYTSQAALFGSLHPSEQSLIRRVAGKLTTLTRGFGRHHLYVPLTLGNHVDHQLTRRAAEAAGGIFGYYEDFPYVAHEQPAWPNPASPVLQERPLTSEIIRITEADLDAWIRSMRHYASQISSFWPDPQAQAEAVRAHASQTGQGGPAQRIWRVG